MLGTGDLELCTEMGRFSCESNLTGIYRVFFRFGNLNFLLDRAAKAYRRQYDTGRMETIRGDGNVTLELHDVPDPQKSIYNAIKGWSLKAAELSGSEVISFKEDFSKDPTRPQRWVFEYY